MHKVSLLLSGILWGTALFGQVELNEGKTQLVTNRQIVEKQKSEAQNVTGHLETLKEKILKLEGELGNKNREYIAGISLVERINDELDFIDKRLRVNENNLRESLTGSRFFIMQQMLGDIDEDQDAQDMYNNRIVEKLLRNQIEQLGQRLNDNLKLRQQKDILQQRLLEYQNVDRDIWSLLGELEQRKKKLSEDYVKELELQEEKSKKEISLEKKRVNKKEIKTKKTAGHYLAPPLVGFKGHQKQDKGIRFEFQGRKDIIAPSAGKVVYAGELASYGHLILIEHKDEIKSVILGSFAPIVQKNDWVEKSAIIGHTSDVVGKNGSIYFEVRKKEKTMNIMDWIDRSKL